MYTFIYIHLYNVCNCQSCPGVEILIPECDAKLCNQTFQGKKKGQISICQVATAPLKASYRDDTDSYIIESYPYLNVFTATSFTQQWLNEGSECMINRLCLL